MKYNDYIEGLKKLLHRNKNGKSFADVAGDFVDIWSNYACLGYALRAMLSAGLKPIDINNVLVSMNRAFEDLSVDDAEKFYFDLDSKSEED